MSATLTPNFSSLDEATNWAIDWLGQNGFTVTKAEDGPFETPKEFCDRMGILSGSLSRSMARGCHPPIQVKRGRSGRIILMRSNAAFERWVRDSRPWLDRPDAGKSTPHLVS